MKNISAFSVPPQLLSAAFAGLFISAVCILAVIGVITVVNVILPEKQSSEKTSAKNREERK